MVRSGMLLRMTGEETACWGGLHPGVRAKVSIPSDSTKPSGRIGAEIVGAFLPRPPHLKAPDLRRALFADTPSTRMEGTGGGAVEPRGIGAEGTGIADVVAFFLMRVGSMV